MNSFHRKTWILSFTVCFIARNINTWTLLPVKYIYTNFKVKNSDILYQKYRVKMAHIFSKYFPEESHVGPIGKESVLTKYGLK